jgi:hypothetical protein
MTNVSELSFDSGPIGPESKDRTGYSRSMIVPVPRPPPQHIETRP